MGILSRYVEVAQRNNDRPGGWDELVDDYDVDRAELQKDATKVATYTARVAQSKDELAQVNKGIGEYERITGFSGGDVPAPYTLMLERARAGEVLKSAESEAKDAAALLMLAQSGAANTNLSAAKARAEKAVAAWQKAGEGVAKANNRLSMASDYEDAYQMKAFATYQLSADSETLRQWQAEQKSDQAHADRLAREAKGEAAYRGCVADPSTCR